MAWDKLLASLAATLQIAGAPATTQSTLAFSTSPKLCLSAPIPSTRITVGTGQKEAFLTITGKGNACDAEHIVHERPFSIDLWTGQITNSLPASLKSGVISSPSEQFTNVSESVQVKTCPSFAVQTSKLPPPKELGMRFQLGRPPATARIGLFTIRDSAGFFHLRSPAGRREAARWILKTLAAASPCWKTWDAETGPGLLKRLYSDLGMRAPNGSL